MADITYIPIRQLYPHPDNPRKELGDLSELAASIKAVSYTHLDVYKRQAVFRSRLWPQNGKL